MLSWHDSTDAFGYPLDSDFRTDLIGLSSGQGWFACYKFDPKKEDWFFYAVPQFMTVSRTDTRDGSLEFCMFGVREFLGRLDRMDLGTQFMGYAHESEFESIGEQLTDRAKDRMSAGEVMCGDPSRFLNDLGRIQPV